MMKIKELYDSPSRWTRGWFARDKDGDRASTFSQEAVCFCLAGAVEKCYPASKEGDEIAYKLENAIRAKGFGRGYINWNDEVATFEDVKSLVEELDI
jgi:hypothetical protein